MTNSTAEVLRAEAEWLETACANAVKHFSGRFSPAYLEGFKAAAGWVRFHAEMHERSEGE